MPSEIADSYEYLAQLAMAAPAMTGSCGLSDTWLASKRRPLASTAHRMRAILLASAIAAFCQPTRASNCTNQREMRSPEPCTELRAAAELREVPHAGYQRRGGHGTDAAQLCLCTA